MRITAAPYMEWAKRHQVEAPPAFDLSCSGVAAVRSEEWPIVRGIPLKSARGHTQVDVAERLARRFGVRPTQVVPTFGTSMANFMALACTPPGPVLMESPGYQPLRSLVETLDRELMLLPRLPADRFAVQLDVVETRLRAGARLVVLTDLYNPAGMAIPVATLHALNQLAEHYDAWVLVDEVYLDAIPAEVRRPCAALLGPRLLASGSLTKVYGLGSLRCGWLVAPEEIVEQARRLIDHLYVVLPAPSEWLAARALDDLSYFHARFDAILNANRPLMEAWLDAHPEVECHRPDGGVIYWCKLPPPLDSRMLEEPLRQRGGVQVAPGHYFGADEWVRIGIGGPVETLARGLAALGEALTALRG
ncbi:MAG: pyridoxal phosphate-dependent aminotransferase [Candidatus Xenobia bacterium]